VHREGRRSQQGTGEKELKEEKEERGKDNDAISMLKKTNLLRPFVDKNTIIEKTKKRKETK
jgi:hypothetical protein